MRDIAPMSDAWVAPFLAALRTTGVVAKAARAAKVSYSTPYALREKDGDFRAAWDDALEESYDTLEAELLDRAVNGVAEPLVHQGMFTFECERDEQGRPVIEQYDSGLLDKDGKPVMGSRHKLKLDELGNPIPCVVRKKSDALLMFALKGRRKRVYAERTEVTGADGAPVAIDATARAARVAQLLALAQQRKAQSEEFDDLA
jgi:hypothetical protein